MKSLLLAVMVAFATALGAGCAVTSGQSTVGTYVDDKVIATRVKARLLEDQSVSGTRIQVESNNGIVQLSGFAVSEAERQRAAQIAASVPDVKQVQNAIAVQPPQ
jgi:hyperosmotically inducible periplasmic protein